MTADSRFDERLRCVFFSLVSKTKGADLVLDAAGRLPEIDFYVYGRLEGDFEGEFNVRADALPNVTYCGVFDSVAGDVIAELNKYDLHLFPSRWPNEGVPGVLVETKMAAVPSVVSDICYNAELVEDGVDGIVLEGCSADSLVSAIAELESSPERLDAMKEAALASAERFYIDRYIDFIVADLKRSTEEEGLCHG